MMPIHSLVPASFSHFKVHFSSAIPGLFDLCCEDRGVAIACQFLEGYPNLCR